MKLSEKFISATKEISTFQNHIPAPYLRKEFDLEFTPETAEITICGLGFYELYINGMNITKGHLAPYISNPEDVCYYDNYEITANLKKGKNVIGIHLGNGFRNPFGWESAIKIITPGGIKKICTADPVIITGELDAIKVTHYDIFPLMYDKIDYDAKPLEATIKRNVYVYDFGVNTAGVTKLTVNGQKGQKIVIHHGELCFDGKHMLNSITQNRKDIIGKYIDYIQTDVFICKGGKETFIPKFKYDGFRYAYVEGLSKEQATKDAVKLLEVHSSVRARAGFNCSDETLNKLQEMTRRADLSNLHYVITDCPHREKMVGQAMWPPLRSICC